MKKISIILLAAVVLASCAPKIGKTTKIYGTLPAGLSEINIKSEKLDTFVRGDKGTFYFETATDLSSVLFFEGGMAELQVIPDGTKLDVVLADSSYVNSRTPSISANERLKAFVNEVQNCVDYESLKSLSLKTINVEKDNAIGALAFLSSYSLMTDDELGQALRTLSSKTRSFGGISIIEKLYNSRKETSSGRPFRDFSVRTIVGYDYGVPTHRNVSLSDYAGQGRFTLLFFWNPRDAVSLEQVPYLKQVKSEFGKKGLDIVSVAMFADADEAFASALDLGFDWVALNGADDTVADLYGVAALPEIVYIAPDGMIIDRDILGEDIVGAARHYFEQIAQ